MGRTDFTRMRCPVARSMAVLGERWAMLVLREAFYGTTRFDEFERHLGIAPNILTDRLRRLEGSGVIASVPYSALPVRVEYRLTEDGQELGSVLRMLAGWGGSTSAAEGPRHAACGTALEARWFCPTCARVVEAVDGSDLTHL